MRTPAQATEAEQAQPNTSPMPEQAADRLTQQVVSDGLHARAGAVWDMGIDDAWGLDLNDYHSGPLRRVSLQKRACQPMRASEGPSGGIYLQKGSSRRNREPAEDVATSQNIPAQPWGSMRKYKGSLGLVRVQVLT